MTDAEIARAIDVFWAALKADATLPSAVGVGAAIRDFAARRAAVQQEGATDTVEIALGVIADHHRLVGESPNMPPETINAIKNVLDNTARAIRIAVRLKPAGRAPGVSDA